MDWLDNPAFDGFFQGASDYSAGVGDGLSFGLTSLARDAMGLNGVVDKCSGIYKGGVGSGVALGIATGGVGSLNAGARSIFYSGGAEALSAARGLAAAGGGRLLENTAGGTALNAINRLIGNRMPGAVWDVASGIFAANARGSATIVLRATGGSAASTLSRVELPILSARGVGLLFF
jgi:hypothetical protein